MTSQDESHTRDAIRDFLNVAVYKDQHNITNSSTVDLAIFTTPRSTEAKDRGVLIEDKSPINAKEMVSTEDANRKALHELAYYFMGARENANDSDGIRSLVITNGWTWYLLKVGGVLVRWNIVPEVSDIRLRHALHHHLPFFMRQPLVPWHEGHVKPLLKRI